MRIVTCFTVLMLAAIATSADTYIPNTPSTAPNCCVGARGNINMVGIVDLSDLSLLISYLTATPRPALPCPDQANINGLGITDLSDLSLLISHLTGAHVEFAPCTFGSVTSWGTCKGLAASLLAPTDSTCIVWSYDGTDITLQHINGLFNCCISSVVITIDSVGDSTIIRESDTPSPQGYCKCLCNYDINIVIENVSPDIYYIRIDEPNRPPEQQIRLTVNLLTNPTGRYCLPIL